ncbi:ribosomal protection-like ABC-F family protein [Anaerocolumna chitinilytica]|uniref:Lsa family ABC-F type ribosomal protection protein n=1 Tax=Anaerocolumna chitinilytica TaxID=1727145 RepID=A0A7M3S9M8_9FIRM|nr:ATP-binding cassette domain-containing protein [Anaerocolumna chitinilytica]BCK01296.1 Lsa family ABC-F type ribosomal protection protein [Anaerocolumna chitinilytica]
MSQIMITEMSFSYKTFYEPIFEKVTLNLDTDWRLGLIGRNGRGKTTFLKLLHKEFLPDKGTIKMEVNTELFPYENKVRYSLTMDVIKENIGGLRTLEDNLEDMEALGRYLELDGFSMESLIKKEMYRMKLAEELLYRDFSLLSEGEKTKVLLIALFLRKDTYLLLDEPTNHLDIRGKKDVAEYLKRKKGFLVVSHDRSFLDEVADHILAINKSDITLEQGNFTTWKRNKDLKDEFEARAGERLNREVRQLERHAKESRLWGGTANTQKYAFASHARTNGAKAFMGQAKRSEQQIMNKIEEKKTLLLNYETAAKLEFEQLETEGTLLLKGKDIMYSYDGRELFYGLSFDIKKGDRIWVRGENGSGKSTLLKLISGKLSTRGFIRTEDLKITEALQEPLWREGYLKGFIKDGNGDDFEKLCRLFDLPDSLFERPLETFSRGELKKIEIARALSMENHLILLDEPLNYMDLYFREQLESAVLAINPTLVFVEHDEWFGEKVATKVITIGN